MSKVIKLLLLGAGNRGSAYADYARRHPRVASVVGVAEPRAPFRDTLVSKHPLAAQHAVQDWPELLSRGVEADAVIIATPDALHEAPAIAFAEKGYNILLEKPMAPTEAACKRIYQAVLKHKVIFAVCHVLRYTHYSQKLKSLLDSGLIGDVVSIQHLEPVGFWHYAHSYVRGNWRNTQESSFMLLSKSCHDVDWLRYMMGLPCQYVTSFGSLHHFRKENKPHGASERCLECEVEASCPYSAKRFYKELVSRGEGGWPLSVLAAQPTQANIIEALKTGPYGRCVYACDNDVVDHQVVNMQFERGKTASFTMTAFTPMSDRKTRIFGSLGQLEGDGNQIKHYDFLSQKETVVKVNHLAGSILGGHGGGDDRLMEAFLSALRTKTSQPILSGAHESLETHLVAFAAERARLENRVVKLSEYSL